MKKLWQQHQLLFVLAVFLVVVLSTGTVATWWEYTTNESFGIDHHAEFWSREFGAYWYMQFAMNFAPEIAGIITLIVLAAQLREKYEASK